MQDNVYDTIIVGSGPAGLTAAIYNVRSALKTIVVAGNQPGGQLTLTTTVDNFPGFPEGVGGVKLMMDTQQQVRNLGVTIRNNSVTKITNNQKTISKQVPITNFPSSKLFEVELDNGEKLQARAVIVATGARAKWLQIPKERELVGKGVSGCATCDGMFFRDKTVVVVGGGETAVEDAEFLARMAKKVYIIHRRDELRTSASAQKRVFANPKIEMVWNSEVVEINCQLSVTSYELEKLQNIKIKNNKTGEEKIMEIEGLFVAIGRQPETEFVKDLVELRDEGYVVTGKNPEYPMMTTLEGVFAAGDCMDSIYRQAIVAAGAGARAALDAERWLKNGS
ncbi:MAG: thioredoxin-disulfide reductase [Candidatus Shapirobacteria bacterium]|jgi:thioredoxin reductase (NADPH)